MRKKTIILLTIILTSFLAGSGPINETDHGQYTEGPYFDVVFLCGLEDFESIYGFDTYNSQLEKITSSMNLSYFYYRGSDLPNVQANMLILFTHGNLEYTGMMGAAYSNSELFTWFDRINLNYLISESCYSGRFFSLPSSISILACSNDTTANIGFSEDVNNNLVNVEWSMLPFFIDCFSFNLTSAYFNIVSDLKSHHLSNNQTIWTRTNNKILSAFVG